MNEDVFSSFKHKLEHLEYFNNYELEELCEQFGRISVEFEKALSKFLTNNSAYSIELRRGIQNRQFMIDLIPRFQKWLKTLPLDTHLRVLDVGPSWALGTNLLAGLYKRPYLGYSLDITAVDIRPLYLSYVKAFCPHIKYRIQDVFTMEENFDVVICSHVIEHVDNPRNFVDQLVKKAKSRVFLIAPYMEQEPRATNHVNTFDENFFQDLEIETFEVTESPAWGPRSNPAKQMCIAELRGKA